jgi:hypothetical protein
MGEIPLLTREEEIRLAKKIELTRMAFRQKVLESDYCAGLAVEILQQVHDGVLPFDRTMKISTSEHAGKSRIGSCIPVNLHIVRADEAERAGMDAVAKRVGRGHAPEVNRGHARPAAEDFQIAGRTVSPHQPDSAAHEEATRAASENDGAGAASGRSTEAAHPS